MKCYLLTFKRPGFGLKRVTVVASSRAEALSLADMLKGALVELPGQYYLDAVQELPG